MQNENTFPTLDKFILNEVPDDMYDDFVSYMQQVKAYGDFLFLQEVQHYKNLEDAEEQREKGEHLTCKFLLSLA